MQFDVRANALPKLNTGKPGEDEVVIVDAASVSPLEMNLAKTHQKMLDGVTAFRNLAPSDIPHFELIADMAEKLHPDLNLSDPDTRNEWFLSVWRSRVGAPIDIAKLNELTQDDIKTPDKKGFFAFPHRMALAASDQVMASLLNYAPGMFESEGDRFFLNSDYAYRTGTDIGNGAGSAMEQLENGVLDMVAKGGIVRGVEFAKPRFLPSGLGNMQASLVTSKYGVCGGSSTTNSACNSAGAAAANIYGKIKAGVLDIGLVGGSDYVEALNTRLTFDNMMGRRGALTRSHSDPTHPLLAFAKERDGFSPGDYGGLQIWMRRSLADTLNIPYRLKVLTALHTGDPVQSETIRTGKKISETNGSVVGQAQAMKIAMLHAGVTPESFSGNVIHWLHATGTGEGAKNEFTAVGAAMSDYLAEGRWIGTSTKENMGHSLGGAMQQNIDIAYQSVVTGKVPHMPSTIEVDPALLEATDDYLEVGKESLEAVANGLLLRGNNGEMTSDDIIVANAFGFGGTNGVIVLQPMN